jgi:predicted PurR-regulated permease PerM
MRSGIWGSNESFASDYATKHLEIVKGCGFGTPADRATKGRFVGYQRKVPPEEGALDELAGRNGIKRAGAQRRASTHDFGLRLTDPLPLSAVSNLWRIAAQAATIGIFVILLIAALDLARPVVMPATAAVVIGLMLGPVSSRADRLGVPLIVTAIVLWLAVIGVFYGVIVLLSQPIGDWVAKAPQIGSSIRDKLHVFDSLWSSLGELRTAVGAGSQEGGVKVDLMAVLQPALLYVTPAVGELVVFFGTLFFFLLGRIRLRHMLVAIFDAHEARLRTLKIMNDVEHNLTSYLSVVALINFVVGIAGFCIAYFTGLPDAVAWGVLAFVLNFIPYLGALIMELVLFAVGLVTFPTLTHALIPPLLYLGFSTLEGHFITPSIMGRRLTLNPLTVFLSLAFWTWLWGPIGAFLSVPILILLLVIANHLFPKDEPVLPT